MPLRASSVPTSRNSSTMLVLQAYIISGFLIVRGEFRRCLPASPWTQCVRRGLMRFVPRSNTASPAVRVFLSINLSRKPGNGSPILPPAQRQVDARELSPAAGGGLDKIRQRGVLATRQFLTICRRARENGTTNDQPLRVHRRLTRTECILSLARANLGSAWHQGRQLGCLGGCSPQYAAKLLSSLAGSVPSKDWAGMFFK